MDKLSGKNITNLKKAKKSDSSEEPLDDIEDDTIDDPNYAEEEDHDFSSDKEKKETKAKSKSKAKEKEE